MFDIGWPEMAVIMLVAIIVIGPRDLPRVARTLGRWTSKARALTRDFQRSLDEMAREAELEDIKKTISDARKVNPKRAIEKTIDPEGELGDAFDVEERGKKNGAGKRKGGAAKKPAVTDKVSEPDDPPGEGETARQEAGEGEPVRHAPAAKRKAEPQPANGDDRSH